MNLTGIEVVALDAAAVAEAVPQLSQILIDCVAGGAGVNFMHPLAPEAAHTYWRGKALPAIERGDNLLFAARHDGVLFGTVQLVVGMVENQPHRGEITKLLVAPSARRHGIGRALMEAAQARAAELGKTLLLLDTETGGLAEQLYLSLGWQEVGVVPGFALTPQGQLCATTFLYKQL